MNKFNSELRKLLEYIESDEEKHYEECDEDQKKHHVYNTIKYLRNNISKIRKVTIEVYGGVADVTKCPADVDVTIIDHDNEGR